MEGGGSILRDGMSGVELDGLLEGHDELTKCTVEREVELTERERCRNVEMLGGRRREMRA